MDRGGLEERFEGRKAGEGWGNGREERERGGERGMRGKVTQVGKRDAWKKVRGVQTWNLCAHSAPDFTN